MIRIDSFMEERANNACILDHHKGKKVSPSKLNVKYLSGQMMLVQISKLYKLARPQDVIVGS